MTDLTTEQSLAGIEINNRLFFRLFQAANTLHTKGTQALDEFGIHPAMVGARCPVAPPGRGGHDRQ
jgi:hypothetical protein